MTRKKSQPRDWHRTAELFLRGRTRTRRVDTGNTNAAKVAAFRLRKRHARDPITIRAEKSDVVFEKWED